MKQNQKVVFNLFVFIIILVINSFYKSLRQKKELQFIETPENFIHTVLLFSGFTKKEEIKICKKSIVHYVFCSLILIFIFILTQQI